MTRHVARGRTVLAVGTLMMGVALTAACDTATEADPDAGVAATARQTSDPRDGMGGGTTGGSTAAKNQTFTVDSRASLIKALGGDNRTNGRNDTPKIVVIKGDIDLRTDDQGKPLPCEDFAVDDFSYDDYLTRYDPEAYGRDKAPSGPLEDAREASTERQGQHTRIAIGSNTTIFGASGARLRGGSLYLDGVDNVIVRNLDISGAADCFPLWDATDGDRGSFNSEFDTVSVLRSNKIWVDHNAMSDGPRDMARPERFGVPFSTYDGLLDITEGSTNITVSYNDFANHAHALLIGSSDSKVTDRGKLAVTLHHNRFSVGERAPRVRFGEVDAYNNLYLTDSPFYNYLIGVGLDSHIVLENNVVSTAADQPLSTAVENLKGTRLTERGTLVKRGDDPPVPASLRTAYNDDDAHPAKITEEAGFRPTQRVGVEPAADVLQSVPKQVGPGHVTAP